uniref:Uncharacterized protein n=1 Tax=Scleropages formosus TaxID=113540 RepID=A0A8C9U218_SCLFO
LLTPALTCLDHVSVCLLGTVLLTEYNQQPSGCMSSKNNVKMLTSLVLVCADVECVIMNLEYLNCTWSSGSAPEFNYTFIQFMHYT